MGLRHTLSIKFGASLSIRDTFIHAEKNHDCTLKNSFAVLSSTLMWLAERLMQAMMHIHNIKAL